MTYQRLKHVNLRCTATNEGTIGPARAWMRVVIVTSAGRKPLTGQVAELHVVKLIALSERCLGPTWSMSFTFADDVPSKVWFFRVPTSQES